MSSGCVLLVCDVRWARETDRGEADPDLLELATREGRTLITYDKDFGDLVHRNRMPAPCVVILFRIHPSVPDTVKTEFVASSVMAWDSLPSESGLFRYATSEVSSANGPGVLKSVAEDPAFSGQGDKLCNEDDMSTFGDDLIQSLTEALAHAKGDGPAIVHTPISPRKGPQGGEAHAGADGAVMGMTCPGIGNRSRERGGSAVRRRRFCARSRKSRRQ